MIEEMGGMIKAIERGYIQKEVQDTAYKYQQDVEKGERVVVGLNKFIIEEEPPKDLLKLIEDVVLNKRKDCGMGPKQFFHSRCKKILDKTLRALSCQIP